MTNYFVHGLQRIILQYTPRSFLKEANVNAPYSQSGGNDTFFSFFLQLKTRRHVDLGLAQIPDGAESFRIDPIISETKSNYITYDLSFHPYNTSLESSLYKTHS